MFNDMTMNKIEYKGTMYKVYSKTELKESAQGEKQIYYVIKIYKGLTKVYYGWIPSWDAKSETDAMHKAFERMKTK